MPAPETSQRFSKSIIWDLQRQYFEEMNVDAWQSGDVPHYISSNPRMAQAYANLIVSFLRDRENRGASDEPYYLVELGAGSGRFSYHLLKALHVMMERGVIAAHQLVYVMTDFVTETLAFWESHPRLQPFVEQGILDYALFDVEKDQSILLKKAGKKIGPKTLSQPILVVANYFFDSIPQELLFFKEGRAYDAQVTISTADLPGEGDAKSAIAHIALSYNYQELTKNPYAGQPRLEELFNYYQKHLSNGHLLFPELGLKCLERLNSYSTEGMMLITADKAIHRFRNLSDQPAPFIARHGSISLTANYHAMKEHCLLCGGGTLFPTHVANSITIGVLLYLEAADEYKTTINSYFQWVDDYGPDDFHSMKKHVDQQADDLTCKQILAYLRWSNYDAQLLNRFLPRLGAIVEEMTGEERLQVKQIAKRVWDGFYPIAEKNDLALKIGTLLTNLSFFEDALSFFDVSERTYGSTALLWFSRACCLDLAGRGEQAIEIMTQLAEQDYEPATSILLQWGQEKNPGTS
jgi:hypothetical protein